MCRSDFKMTFYQCMDSTLQCSYYGVGIRLYTDFLPVCGYDFTMTSFYQCVYPIRLYNEFLSFYQCMETTLHRLPTSVWIRLNKDFLPVCGYSYQIVESKITFFRRSIFKHNYLWPPKMYSDIFKDNLCIFPM